MANRSIQYIILPIVRWALAPLLLYLASQFLEGPSYRVIVRSFPFVFGWFGVAIFAGQFVCHQRWLSPKVVAIPVLLVPLYFIWSVQGYYDGGKNPYFAHSAGISAALMGIVLCFYLLSLLHPFFNDNGRGYMRSP